MTLNELIGRSGLVQPAGADAGTFYLHAGQVHVATEPTRITTVLGSCVAICLWDPLLGIGGMNHYLLPSNSKLGERAPRFADTATIALLEALLAAGVSLPRLKAKIFGGASVLAFTGGALAEKNVQAAREQLARWDIPIVAADVGGIHGRKIIFQTDTGETTVKVLR
ncbi:MAG TPA: chemotaxis protein CheD [Thermoanaerobaculia bacterium]|jgi:chemotaxis protein CheD|nr:chemotaxis protein CheD [Thermoanaerobaculia bacterium]